jgi:DNA-binding transcriptional LysR family regulator
MSTALAGIDLNLLVALDALLTETHVTRAARRVGLTQPAMSHALARLRQLLDDPLLVRTTRGMAKTPRAAALGPDVRRILGDIETALRPSGPFDPSAVKRTFTIATADYASFVLLPSLIARLEATAPGIDLRVVPIPSALPDLASALEDAVDLALTPPNTASPALYQKPLLEDRFVCVVRRGHPRIKTKLTLRRFVAEKHLFIALRGTPGGAVDTALATIGQARRVGVMVPHFTVAPFLVATSDLVLTLAERMARRFAELLPLRLFPTPLEVPGFSIAQVWHARRHKDPAHVWLRAEVSKVAGGGAPRDGKRRA